MFQSLDLFVLSCLFLAAESQTELVKDLECYIVSSEHAHCSWSPASHAQDLRASYALWNEDLSISIHDTSPPLYFQKCSSYSNNGSSRTGCDLQATINQEIKFWFSGTLNNMLVNNTTIRKKFELRPPPLSWTVTKTRDAFNISWIPPDIAPLHRWKFIMNYTECNKPKEQTINDKTSFQLALVSNCQYRIAIKAEHIDGNGKTPWSDEKYFDADTDPNVVVYAAIIIPLMFAGLAALTFVCCRKNKENIFPKVPEPRDLLSDISDNNNKSTAHNLYVPAEEEDNCKITLVIDPKIN